MKFKDKYGPWALVTGASSGIGEEFAEQLAAMGFNIVLVAQNQERLGKISQRIRERHGIDTLTISINLSEPDFMNELTAKTASIDVGLLVSNAAAYRYGSFHKSDLKEINSLLSLNTHAHTQLAHFYGNKMKAKGKGGILFVSSTGAFWAIPYMASYVASKAYVLSLGESLHIELKEHGVDVMVLTPGLTETPGTVDAKHVDNSKLGASFMSPKVVVAQALKVFGTKAMHIPGGMNKFSFFLGKRILTRLAMAKLLGRIIRKAVSREVI